MTVPKPARLHVENLPTVFPNAAGLDIGSAEIVAALPPDRAATVVRAFTTFTADLRQLVTWLLEHQIDTVAMESTGVYWIPIYEMLEAAGLRVFLVNARHFKIVPGRKSDYNDAQWLQKLHALGLLTGSFRPDDEMCVLRSLLRHRAQLIEHRSPHILHMQKALKLMNLQLPEVLADVTGVTGLAILRAIVAGERRGAVLAQLRRPGCHHTEQDIIQALTGTWREEHLFVLAQSLDLYDFYSRKIFLTRGNRSESVELGVVRMDLRCVEQLARQEILQGRQPLGAILVRHKLLLRIEPRWYLKFPAGSPVLSWMGYPRQGPFFGRIGTIYCNDEPAIELLEIVTLWNERT